MSATAGEDQEVSWRKTGKPGSSLWVPAPDQTWMWWSHDGLDDVELAVLVDVGDGGGGEVAGLVDAVAGLLLEDHLVAQARGERPDVAGGVGGDDVEAAVAVEVDDERGGLHRAGAGVERPQVGAVGRPALDGAVGEAVDDLQLPARADRRDRRATSSATR